MQYINDVMNICVQLSSGTVVKYITTNVTPPPSTNESHLTLYSRNITPQSTSRHCRPRSVQHC